MPKNYCIMQIWAESGKSALPICNYSQILYQFLTFTQNLKRSRIQPDIEGNNGCRLLTQFLLQERQSYVNTARFVIQRSLFPASTINADWIRLSNILFDYFEWFVDKNQVFFMSTDSQSMSINPFHRIYRFCRYNERDPKTFFNIIFALSPSVSLAHGTASDFCLDN